MSDIVLSASVRQNLLSLQSTADLLSTTQNRLSTGNKVNSALDNPTNYFTSQSLNSRASDISNLLDGISNGVQVLQAANTGITSLQKLVDSAKSVAQQALQATSGYSTKSQAVSTAITGATASNILGATTTTPAAGGTFTAGAFTTLDVSAVGAGSAATFTEAANSFTAPLNVAGTQSTLAGSGTFTSLDLSGSNSISLDVSIGGSAQSITIDSAAIVAAGGTAATASEANVISALNTKLNTAFGTSSVVYAADNAGNIDISSGTKGTSSQVAITNYTESGTLGGVSSLANGTATAGTSPNSLSFGLQLDSAGSPTTITIDQDAVNAYNTATSSSLDASSLSGANIASIINHQAGAAVATYDGTNHDFTFTSATSGTGSHVTITGTAATGTTSNTTGIANHALTSGAAGTPASVGFSVSVDGTPHSVSISAAALATYNGDTANAASLITDTAAGLSAADVSKLVNYQVGSAVSSVSSGGALVFTSAAGSTHSVATSAITTVGTVTGSTGVALHSAAAGTDAVTTGGLSGTNLTIASTDGGTALNISFGTGTETSNTTTGVATNVSTLDQLNTILAANNLTASIDTTGVLTLTTTNDHASSTIGAIGGTAVGSTAPLGTFAAVGPVADANAQNIRSNLVTQYNNIIQQIKTTAQDSSYNGVNLLNGDQLKLVFNETGKSTLNIAGVTDDPAGLGLSALTSGTDFVDNTATNKVLSQLDGATNTLRTQASSLGSNLSIVQIRQDFSKNLINVLQTGASNLTLADTNEEAANSQALSTRQSIAVSALALANTSQQSVLQLLR